MKKNIISFSLLSALIFSLLAMSAQAQDLSNTINGLNESANQVNAFIPQVKPAGDTYYGQTFLSTQVGKIIGVVLSLVGVLFLILMLYAGIMWMVSRGNEQEVTKAKDLLTNAIIGIIIVFAAYALTAFIGTALLKPETL